MKSITKVSIIDSVIITIKELIMSGNVSIGEKLPTEREICEQLNVSRSTVREAFRALQTMGLVEIVHGKGAYVASNYETNLSNVSNWFVENEVQVADLMEIRLAMEPLAIKLAMKRASDEEIKELVNKLKKTQESLKSAIKLNDIIRMEICDKVFHSNISEATKNNLIISINEKISESILQYRINIFSIRQNAENAISAHERIIHAIERRDTLEAFNAMSIHINNALNDAMILLKKGNI